MSSRDQPWNGFLRAAIKADVGDFLDVESCLNVSGRSGRVIEEGRVEV